MNDNFSGLIALVVETLANEVDDDSWQVFGSWAEQNKDVVGMVSEKDACAYYIFELHRSYGTTEVDVSPLLLARDNDEFIEWLIDECLELFDCNHPFTVEDVSHG